MYLFLGRSQTRLGTFLTSSLYICIYVKALAQISCILDVHSKYWGVVSKILGMFPIVSWNFVFGLTAFVKFRALWNLFWNLLDLCRFSQRGILYSQDFRSVLKLFEAKCWQCSQNWLAMIGIFSLGSTLVLRSLVMFLLYAILVNSSNVHPENCSPDYWFSIGPGCSLSRCLILRCG